MATASTHLRVSTGMQPGLRISANFMQNGRPQWFGGVILARAACGWKVRFDDGEERPMTENSLEPEELVEDCGLSREMAACVARLRELRGRVTSASACRVFALDLERLQMEYFATSAQLGRVQGTPAARSPSSPPPAPSLHLDAQAPLENSAPCVPECSSKCVHS